MGFRSKEISAHARRRAVCALLASAPLAPLFLLCPAAAHAVSCTSQAELTAADRTAIAAAAEQISTDVASQNYPGLQAALLPAEASDWNAIRSAVEDSAPLMKGGQIQLDDAYLLDATSLTAPEDSEFFCSNASGSLTVTMSMRALPPGRYAVILANAEGAPLDGQEGLVLAWDGGWKLAGLSIHQGKFDGHDGVWFWARARVLSGSDPWSAYYLYDLARSMLLPVNFLSSPNLEKLDTEQSEIKNSPKDAFPYSVPDGPRTWKIDSVDVNTILHQADLGVTYESTGVTTPAALHTEAVAVLSALLHAQPGLRESFHGMWAIASYNGKKTPIIELPMAQIP
ncbi:MAG TPA: hypothetical protein VMA34_14535 [Terracidiphilus sp.]|nr:hypothetical protein [Terracidiphilus sp.]